MQQLSITRTKDYIIFKIPVKPFGRSNFSVTSKEEKLIQDGLKAIKGGQLSKKFKNAQEAVCYLRSL